MFSDAYLHVNIQGSITFCLGLNVLSNVLTTNGPIYKMPRSIVKVIEMSQVIVWFWQDWQPIGDDK